MKLLRWKNGAPGGFTDTVLVAKRYEHTYLIVEGDAGEGKHYSASYRDVSVAGLPERTIGDSFETPYPDLDQAKAACERDYLKLRGARQ